MAIPVFGETPTGTGTEDLDTASITVGSGTAASPSVVVGGDGLYSSGAGQLDLSFSGVQKWFFTSLLFAPINGTGGALIGEDATNTNPTVLVRRNDTNTGLGGVTGDTVVVITGAVQAMTWIENGGVLQLSQITAGITADTGSSQGDGALTSSFNEISVCANAGDAVTMPAAVVNQSYIVTIINNGANACDVFPASSDDLGAGADTAVSLAAGANITYRNYDATNWVALT